jgi:hypothetical protein
MFFEFRREEKRNSLAISKDAGHWEYQQIILSVPFHLSNPYIGRCKMSFI